MAMILITHDLGVIAGVADRVMIMYAGKIVEQAARKELFANPRHPYTLALLRSIPRLDGRAHARLSSIPGAPPDLVDPPPACRFAQRCNRVTDECREMEPPLVPLGREDHLVACYRPIAPEERAHA